MWRKYCGGTQIIKRNGTAVVGTTVIGGGDAGGGVVRRGWEGRGWVGGMDTPSCPGS